MQSFIKHVHVADMTTPAQRKAPIFITITWKEGKLSIRGVEGPTSNGDCFGSCGQCLPKDDWENPHIDLDKLSEIWSRWHLNDMNPCCEHQRAQGWMEKASEEVVITHFILKTKHWQRQREIKEEVVSKLADGETLVLSKEDQSFLKLPLSTIKEPEGKTRDLYEIGKVETKTKGWCREEEHPDGLLCKACPVCGYKYGTAWKKEEVPSDVIEWLYNLKGGPAIIPSCWAK